MSPRAPADRAWRAALVWLANCPVVLPGAHIAVGDDASVVMEWTTDARHVSVAFDSDGVGSIALTDEAKGFAASVEDLSTDAQAVRLILRILQNGTTTH